MLLKTIIDESYIKIIMYDKTVSNIATATKPFLIWGQNFASHVKFIPEFIT